mmetsp:Transcript_16429/g.24362  ORF Transcript_16429/g.24362 Transcript_16429/m.24362 type:complete len:398 (-) Transcript_16429:126-1319(-)
MSSTTTTTATDSALRKIQVSYAITILIALISMIVYLTKYITPNYGCNNDDDGNDGDDGEGCRRDGPEGEGWGKLLFTSIWLMLTAVVLGGVGAFFFWKVSYLRIGMLSGALFMYSNLALVCSMYYWNLQAPEEEREEDRQRFLEDADEEQDMEEAEQFAERVLSAIGLGLSFIFFITGALMISSSMSMNLPPPPSSSTTQNTNTNVGSGGNIQIFCDAWKYLSTSSICAMVLILIIALASLAFEEADRMREEGLIWNFLILIFWLLWTCVVMFYFGHRIFIKKGSSIGDGVAASPMTTMLEFGIFLGKLYFFVVVAFFLGCMYIPIAFDDRRRREEGPFGSTLFSFLCFAFGIAYVAFARLAHKYHEMIISAKNNAQSEEELGNNFVELREQRSDMV